MSGINKETAERFLGKVSDGTRFFCSDGQVFSTLEELEKSLKKMSKETFSFHVNSEKNDFSSWIYNVIGDVELADNVRKTKDKKKINKELSERIIRLKKLL